MAPVSSVSFGVPVTATAWLKFTCTLMELPTLYEPLEVLEVTPVMVGGVMATRERAVPVG